MRKRITFLIFILFSVLSIGKAQYKSIDFEIGGSPYFDDRRFSEPSRNYSNIVGIVQIGTGYSAEISKNLVISPKVAFGIGREMYYSNLSSAPNALPDSNQYDIKRRATFLKVGLALSYWFQSTGKGFCAESEIQNILPISAVSIENYLTGNQSTVEQTFDYKHELTSSVPSLRIGIGYNIPIKRVILFARISLEFRLSAYFTTSNNYTWANRSMGFGFRYLLRNSKS